MGAQAPEPRCGVSRQIMVREGAGTIHLKGLKRGLRALTQKSAYALFTAASVTAV